MDNGSINKITLVWLNSVEDIYFAPLGEAITMYWRKYMSIHLYDNNMKPDSEYINGMISLLVVGNQCRLLDGRRTTGYIEKIFLDSGMFRWRITKYEDTGSYWDLPIEDVSRFQFPYDSKELPKKEVTKLLQIIEKLYKEIVIEANIQL